MDCVYRVLWISFGTFRKFIYREWQKCMKLLWSDHRTLWSVIAASHIFWKGVAYLPAVKLPVLGLFLKCYFLLTNDCLGENSLCILFCWEPGGYGKTACSSAHTFRFPAERSSSVPSFTSSVPPFIFHNSLCVESAFLIKLFASRICSIYSLWGHFYYSRRVVIYKSQE